MNNLTTKLKSLRLNWTNILEQAIGALIAAILIVFLGYLYNLITGQAQPTIWFWAGLISFIVVLAVGLVWKTIRKILAAMGQWIIRNWKLITSIALISTVSYSSYLLLRVIWIPVLILGLILAILLAVSWLEQRYVRGLERVFIPIELNPRNIANEHLVDKFVNPPVGSVILGGVDFLLNSEASILDTSKARDIEPDGTTHWQIRFPEPVQSSVAVHLLINAGGGWERDPDTDTGLKWMKVGRIQLVFEDNTIQETDLRLGDNLREWAIGNFPGKLVDHILDTTSQVVWRGNTREGRFAVIDKLVVAIFPKNLHKRLASVNFRRDIRHDADAEEGGRVDFLVFGVSIEVKNR